MSTRQALLRGLLTTALTLAATLPAAARDDYSGAAIRALGLEARLDAAVREERIRELARLMEAWGPDRVHPMQGDFQYALLLQCDPEIYDTLAPETIDAVDNALESLFGLEEIDRDNHWEPLIYVYGFFNRDVTLETISGVLERWDAMSAGEKAPRYPTYIHVIDAVCKPVSMGPVGDIANTRSVLARVIPAMKSQFQLPPAPGTAFHPPSHACLVLGPLYERWSAHPETAPMVRELLGDRQEFETMLWEQLPGAHARKGPLDATSLKFHTYIGSYLANALARSGVQSALPALRETRDLYVANGIDGRPLAYTQRALAALGDDAERSAIERALADPAAREDATATLVWIARNAAGEGQAYARERLATQFNCRPEDALNVRFARELKSLR